MIKSFIEYFRSYNTEVLIPTKKWIGKHKIGYFIVAPLVGVSLGYAYFLYLTRDCNKELEVNDYEEEES